jgi:hypothetical protein
LTFVVAFVSDVHASATVSDNQQVDSIKQVAWGFRIVFALSAACALPRVLLLLHLLLRASSLLNCCRDLSEGQQPVFEFPFAIEGDKVRSTVVTCCGGGGFLCRMPPLFTVPDACSSCRLAWCLWYDIRTSTTSILA